MARKSSGILGDFIGTIGPVTGFSVMATSLTPVTSSVKNKGNTSLQLATAGKD